MKRSLINLSSSMLGRWRQRQDIFMVNMPSVSVVFLGRAGDSHMCKQPHQVMHNVTVQLMNLTRAMTGTNHVHAPPLLKQYKARWSTLRNLEQHLTMMKADPPIRMLVVTVITGHQLHHHTHPHIDIGHLPDIAVVIVAGDHAAGVTQGNGIVDIADQDQGTLKEEDTGVAVVAQRDTATSLTQDLKLHTTDLVILTPGQELGQNLRHITVDQDTIDHGPAALTAAAAVVAVVELLVQ